MTWSIVPNLSYILIAGILLILFNLCYHLGFSPLAKFPGPKIAAVTKLYEAYHMLVKRDWYENLQRLHETHGSVVRIGPNELHFVDHSFCLDLQKRPELFKCDNYYGLLNYLLGGLPNPHDHRHRKSMLQPLFSGDTLSQYSNSWLNSLLSSLHKDLAEVASTSPEYNATHLLWAFTNDIMASYLTGRDSEFMKVPGLNRVHDSTRAYSAIDLATILRTMPPVKVMFDVIPHLRANSVMAWLDKFVLSHLGPVSCQRSTEHGAKNSSVIEQFWNQIGNERLVVHELAQAMFIGNESLLSNLTFLLHYMTNNPRVIAALRKELDTLDIGSFGNQIWRDPRVLQLRYLDAICRESTRLSSPEWHRQPRQASFPITYKGQTIPAWTSLSFTLKSLSRDPALYSDPDEFHPERWLARDGESRLKKANPSFGTGSRTCLGQYLAQHVLKKTLACITYNFDISIVNGAEKEEDCSYLATYPTKGHHGFLVIRAASRFTS